MSALISSENGIAVGIFKEVIKHLESAPDASAGIVAASVAAVREALGTGTGAQSLGTPTGSVQTVLDSIGDTSNGIPGAIATGASVLVVGDSMGEGAGATYAQSWAHQLARSIMNRAGVTGYGYHTTINMQSALQESGIASNGTPIASGVVAHRLSLAPGQTITVTGRAVAGVDVMYDASASNGASIEFRLNGALIATKQLAPVGAATGIQNTFWTKIADGALTTETDVIELRAIGATAVITGILSLRAAERAPLVYVAAKANFTYLDFMSPVAMDELAAYLNFARTNDEKVLLIGLGTNSIYRPESGESPVSMVARMGQFIAGMRARCSFLRVGVWVPPKADEAAFPIVSPGVTYESFVSAIVQFGAQNDVAVMRNDRTILGHSKMLADGVHPLPVGHGALAQTACATAGVMLDPRQPSPIGEARTTFARSGTWAGFSGSALNVKRAGNQISFAAILAPGAALEVGVLPVGWRPVGRDLYLVARTDAGPVALDITMAGVISVKALPEQYLSLEGVTFVIHI